MERNFARNVVAVAVLAAPLSVAPAFAWPPVAGDVPEGPHFVSTAAESTQGHCFFRRNWLGGWRATPDARTVYIRVSGDIYRLDLATSYSLLKDPFAILINRGASDSICTPLDFRLTVSNRAGGVQGVIVKHLRRLTPAEAAALPNDLRP